MSKYQYFFIPGAAKSGTTTLADELGRHFEICVAKDKEPDFFARNYDKGGTWYESIFEDKQAKYRLDASTSYMAGFHGDSTEFLQRIKQFDENAKFIFLVREPISRAWSSYWHAVRGGFESLTYEDSIRRPHCPHIEGSRYYARVSEFLNVFNQEQIMIVDFKRLVSCPSSVIEEVFEFIGIEHKCLEKPERRQSNASFQWNGAGKILNLVPNPVLKTTNRILKKLLPGWLLSFLKKSVSKPIPVITEDQKKLTRSILLDDINAYNAMFKLNDGES